LCLARSGHDVLLIDPGDFPRDKVCGDLIVPSVFRVLRKAGISQKTILQRAYPIDKVYLFGPFGTQLPIQFDPGAPGSEIMVIRRKRLDEYLLDIAESAGAQRCTGRVKGVQCTKQSVILDVKEGKRYQRYSSRAVIGADGVSSILSRRMACKPWQHRAIAIRGYIEGISLQPHAIEAHFISELWPGYAWIFPTSTNSANIGLGFDTRHYKKTERPFKRSLQRFLQQPMIRKRLSRKYTISDIRAFPINLGPPAWERLVGDRYILTGDAAGLANAMTGGGIANAMYSGMIAAEVLAGNLIKDTLTRKYQKEYVRIIQKTLGQELWLSYMLSRVISLSPYVARHILRSALRTSWPYSIINRIYTDVCIDRVRHNKKTGIRIEIKDIGDSLHPVH